MRRGSTSPSEWVTSTKHAQWDRISSASRCLFVHYNRWGVFFAALPCASQYALFQIHHRAPPPSTTYRLWLLSLPRLQYDITKCHLKGSEDYLLLAALYQRPLSRRKAQRRWSLVARHDVPRAPLCKQLDNTAIASTDPDVPTTVPITITARSYLALALAADCFSTHAIPSVGRPPQKVTAP